MPNFRRYFVPGGTYFFTVVTDGRAPIFEDARARRILGEALRACRERRPFSTPAIVLLPDHLHAVWTLPPGDDGYARRWGEIKARLTRDWLSAGGAERPTTAGRRREGRRGVLQPKYWEHAIRDELDLEHHVEYIHANPVRHGLVARARDWPHSSFHRWVRAGDYPADWCSDPSAFHGLHAGE